MAKKIVTIDEIEDALKDFSKKDKINEKNPYLKNNKNSKNPLDDSRQFLKEKIEEFLIDLENGNSKFSWIDKLKGEKNIDEEDKDKIANIHYGLPSHIHGNYRDGLIYLCLFNPNVVEIQDSNLIYKSEKSKKKSTKICSIKDYYTKPPMVEGKNDLANEEFWTIINEYKTWYKNEKKEENINKLVDIIISEESTLTKELKNMDKDHYYIDKYYKVLKSEVIDKLENNDKKYKITDRIVNIDLCPFRAKNAGTVTNEILNTQFSEFSAYIIWYRIGKYLNDLENYRKNIVRQIEKPLFIFRSYSKWQYKLVATLHKIHNEEIDNEIIEGYIEKINLEFFYHFPNQSGMISQNNLKKFVSKDEFDGIKGLINKQN
ncbi:hypothetical protein [Anaerococcus obesiensis]|uniref:hypothetical protein n=1 Tax=Anaerococcus obesiensis TaxID=1287640 RepID=UPI0003196284|nr:hypothetical protein [Anaerococcus obesiensis]